MTFFMEKRRKQEGAVENRVLNGANGTVHTFETNVPGYLRI